MSQHGWMVGATCTFTRSDGQELTGKLLAVRDGTWTIDIGLSVLVEWSEESVVGVRLADTDDEGNAKEN